MTSREAFSVGSGFGALFVIGCLHVGARIAGKHVLEMITKENK